ncbi:hypothetical protein Dvina_46495 [Dactylosporangium vinaceum]|uniref:Lipoprotein n=1 Tax=Dactylosporangium vinaceum TaxID=53362 RepID=A0ABV5M7J3_9ACTN|nr:hypothetical protein [Dactylosporangium vinaceum]UAB95397.1 hypothetical protein Dvina_46495 [Dactylosporangium vinaceum]
MNTSRTSSRTRSATFARVERLAILIAAALALGACSGSSGDAPQAAPTSAAAVPTDAPGAFKAAVAKTIAVSMTFTLVADAGEVGTQTGQGAIDPARKATGYDSELLTTERKIDITAILISPDLYLKVTGLTGDRWAHVDMARVKSLTTLGLDRTGNPTGLASLPDEIVTVTRSGAGSYTGTLDRTKDPLIPDATASEALKSVPFEAKVDPQGYVTELIVRTPPVGTAPATTSTAKFADFGKAPVIERPDSATVEQASDTIYSALQ